MDRLVTVRLVDGVVIATLPEEIDLANVQSVRCEPRRILDAPDRADRRVDPGARHRRRSARRNP